MSEQVNNQRFIFVGLGNPGSEYRGNRHNIGFMAVNQLAEELGVKMLRYMSKSVVGMGKFEDFSVILAKPQTFMNLSGQAVQALTRFYKVSPQNLMVIHDDLDLPYDTIRLRPGGSPGGHKGLISIINQLGTQDFPRLRLGVGRPPGQMDAADYVLQDFSSFEKEMLPEVLRTAVKACLAFMNAGLTQAMNQFNGTINKE